MNNPNTDIKEKSLREILDQYTRYWAWFVLGVVISLSGMMIYLRYTTPLYLSKATVIIKDEKSGGVPDELQAFSELGGFFTRFGRSNLENELSIFNSKRIISNVVDELDLHIVYESVGTIKGFELYEYRPIVVQYMSFVDSLRLKPIPKLYFEILSDTEFKLENSPENLSDTYSFGDLVTLPFGDIIVFPEMEEPEKFNNFIGKKVSVSYTPIETVAHAYQNKLIVQNDIKNSHVVNISLSSPVVQKAEDFINELINQYNKDAINDRNQVARKTADFIDSRLNIIAKELDSVEADKEMFKSRNRITNIEAEAQLILENASEYNKLHSGLESQLELTTAMIDYMKKTTNNDLLPANIGLEGEEIGEAVSNYNQLILQRNKLLRSSTVKNPIILNINNQIEQLGTTILSSLENTSQGLRISIQDLNVQETKLNTKISQVPQKEKLYRGIERQQTIKEQLYLFLLQQREEASISLAVTAPKAKIVDMAYSSKVPVAPKRPLFYLGALLAGLLLPFMVIYISYLLNTFVTNRRDVERVIRDISIIGEIPKLKRGDEELVSRNDRSILAESFRILRTSLQYLFVRSDESLPAKKTVFVTSTIKGEGKTFVAFNLALTIALTGKKVALVGADIRNPQLHRYLPEKFRKNKGLTEFIINESLTLKDLVAQSEHNENLSIILSGTVPPNPAELLMLNRTSSFFEELNEMFDYIIVDTAPSMLVTDTILINKFADITLYVIRAGFTDRRLLEFPKDAMEDGRLSDVALVLNSVDMSNFGYGNKYGYTYSEERPSLLKRIFGI